MAEDKFGTQLEFCGVLPPAIRLRRFTCADDVAALLSPRLRRFTQSHGLYLIVRSLPP